MPGIDRRALKIAWTVFLFVLLVYLLYLIGHTLIVFALAVFLAHLLGSMVEGLERLAPHGITRNMALAIIYLVLGGVAISVVVPLMARAGEQAAALAAQLPAALQDDPLARVPLPIWLEGIRPRLTEAVRSQLTSLDELVAPTLSQIGSGLISGLGNLLAAILIPILSFFLVKDGPIIRRTILSTVPPQQRLMLMELMNDLHNLLAQYIRSLVLLSILVFTAYSIFFAAIGVPYALFLAVISALLEIIPIAGPLVASGLILAAAVLSGYPHVLWVFIFLCVFRLFQDYVINPHLMSSRVAIHPLFVLFGVLAGEQIGGIPGMFFSVPIMAALRIIVLRVRKEAAEAGA